MTGEEGGVAPAPSNPPHFVTVVLDELEARVLPTCVACGQLALLADGQALCARCHTGIREGRR